MSSGSSSGERSEAPTPKRLQDARRRGEVAKSRELSSAMVFVAVSAVVVWTWPQVLSSLGQFCAGWLAQAPRLTGDGSAFAPLAAQAVGGGLKLLVLAVLPIVGAAFLMALAANYLQVGSLLTLQPIKPQLQRFNPLQNFKNIVSKQTLFELIKSVIKVLGFTAIGAHAIWQQAPRLLATVGQQPEQALQETTAALLLVTIRIGILVVFLAGLDLAYQRFAYIKRLCMTKDEVKREHKEAEGDPQRKAERQRVHRELSQEAMLSQIKNADAIIINPTQIAVAVRYDEEQEQAPRVLASGRRLMAAKIRQLARQHGVPIVRNVPLARSLIDIELDEEIPAELYEAVAEVLRFVYSLDDRQ